MDQIQKAWPAPAMAALIPIPAAFPRESWAEGLASDPYLGITRSLVI